MASSDEATIAARRRVADRHDLMMKPDAPGALEIDLDLFVERRPRLDHLPVLGDELGVSTEAVALRVALWRLARRRDQARRRGVHLDDAEIADGARGIAHGLHHEEGVEASLHRGAEAGLADAERLGRAAQIVGARQRERARDEPHEEHGREQRRHGGDGLHAAGEPVPGRPEGEDFEVVRGPARDDEDPEAEEDPVEGEVAATADEVEEREGDRGVREGDDRVGGDVEPDDARLPQVAVPMRHELVRREQGREKIEHGPLAARRLGSVA